MLPTSHHCTTVPSTSFVCFGCCRPWFGAFALLSFTPGLFRPSFTIARQIPRHPWPSRHRTHITRTCKHIRISSCVLCCVGVRLRTPKTRRRYRRRKCAPATCRSLLPDTLRLGHQHLLFDVFAFFTRALAAAAEAPATLQRCCDAWREGQLRAMTNAWAARSLRRARRRDWRHAAAPSVRFVCKLVVEFSLPPPTPHLCRHETKNATRWRKLTLGIDRPTLHC